MLSKKQEEYVIERVKTYSKEIHEIEKSTAKRIFRLGIGAIGAVLMTTKAQDWNMSDWASVPILISCVYYAVHHAGYLIQNIMARLTLCQNMNELLDKAQLMDFAGEEAENNMGKGK